MFTAAALLFTLLAAHCALTIAAGIEGGGGGDLGGGGGDLGGGEGGFIGALVNAGPCPPSPFLEPESRAPNPWTPRLNP